MEAEYAYHINNKRASKTVDGVTTEHIWIGEEIQIDKIDGEMISYVHGIRLIESEYAEDENDCNPYRYAGEYQDRETGYIYLRARHYDPEISRFLNVDPIKDGMNWYGYTGGNPVRYTDPSGLKPWYAEVIESVDSAIKGG